MNKIKMRGEKEEKNIYKNDIIVLKNKDIDFNYDLKEKQNLFIYIEQSTGKLNLNINYNTKINIFSVNASVEINLNLLKENINLEYNYSTINIENNIYKININHNKKNQKSKITNNGVNLDNNLTFIINTIIPKESIKIKTSQDSKIILMKNNKGEIKPNLLIDNDDIEASHSAYIGDFKKEEMFYICSRGISLKNAKKLLAKSFLIGNMNLTYKEIQIILEKLNQYWR